MSWDESPHCREGVWYDFVVVPPINHLTSPVQLFTSLHVLLKRIKKWDKSFLNFYILNHKDYTFYFFRCGITYWRKLWGVWLSYKFLIIIFNSISAKFCTDKVWQNTLHQIIFLLPRLHTSSKKFCISPRKDEKKTCFRVKT